MLFIVEYFQRHQAQPQQEQVEQEKLNCSKEKRCYESKLLLKRTENWLVLCVSVYLKIGYIF